MKTLSIRMRHLLTAMMMGVALLLVVPFAPAHADVIDVTVYDDAGILDDAAVQSKVEALSSDADVRVAVLTSNDPSLTADGYDKEVEALVNRPQYDALRPAEDVGLGRDVILIVISPEVRKVGAYAGDGVAHPDEIADRAVSEMRTPARAADWDATAVAGADAALGATNGPAAEPAADTAAPVDPEAYRTLVTLGVAALVGLGVVFLARPVMGAFGAMRKARKGRMDRSEIKASVAFWRSLYARVAKHSLSDELTQQVLTLATGLQPLSPKDLDELESAHSLPRKMRRGHYQKALRKQWPESRTDKVVLKRCDDQASSVEYGAAASAYRMADGRFKQAQKEVEHFLDKYAEDARVPPKSQKWARGEAKRFESKVDQITKDVDRRALVPGEGARQVDEVVKAFRGSVRNAVTNTRAVREIVADDSSFARNGIMYLLIMDSTWSSPSATSTSSTSHHHSSSSSSSSSYSDSSASSYSSSDFSGGSGDF